VSAQNFNLPSPPSKIFSKCVLVSNFAFFGGNFPARKRLSDNFQTSHNLGQAQSNVVAAAAADTQMKLHSVRIRRIIRAKTALTTVTTTLTTTCGRCCLCWSLSSSSSASLSYSSFITTGCYLRQPVCAINYYAYDVYKASDMDWFFSLCTVLATQPNCHFFAAKLVIINILLF